MVNKSQNQAQYLQTTIDSLLEQNFNLSAALERQQQYSWRNCLLIHGITPSANKNTDEKSKIFYRDYVGIIITDAYIDRIHRLAGATSNIIVKFARHKVKNMVYSLKRKLAKKKFLITESLRQTSKMHEEIESSKRTR